MTRRPQEIHIDQLVLPAGTVGSRKVRAAIEKELARLLTVNPAAAGGSMPVIEVPAATRTDADALGGEVARRVHAEVRRTR